MAERAAGNGKEPAKLVLGCQSCLQAKEMPGVTLGTLLSVRLLNHA